MKPATLQINGRMFSLLNIIVPLLLYGIILAIQIPYLISRAFAFYSVPFFLSTIILFYISFRLPGKFRWLGGAVLTLVLLAFRLSYLWSSGYSNDMIIGGLIPFRDAFDYYHGAKFISVGQLIASGSNRPSWRPLFPGFLASLLFIFQQNMQWSLAALVALAGICFYISAYQVNQKVGPLAAAVYMSLLYFYIQSLIGTAYTEPLGLAFGSLGFVLLWRAAAEKKILDLVLGLVSLTVGLSARAGAFFVLPFLILWAGWTFRGTGRFSFKYAAFVALTLVVSLLMVNIVYNRLVVQPGGVPDGNFSATIYGQVYGGAGYNLAYRSLPSKDPAFIYRAAGQYFLAHPLSFFIGAYKSYRDFFLPQLGALSFFSDDGWIGLGMLLWLAASLLLGWGLFKSIRRISSPEAALFVGSFAGIFLSIPFLPPIDAGNRLYASTMPFVYVLIAVAIGRTLSGTDSHQSLDGFFVAAARTMGIVLGILTVLAPVLILHVNQQPSVNTGDVSCAPAQIPYAVIMDPGSYVDLVPDNSSACGHLPEICLRDFQKNLGSNDSSDQELYRHFTALASGGDLRVFEAQDMVRGGFHFFVGPSADFPNASKSYVIAGCASQIKVPGRPDVYQIHSVNSASAN